MSTPSASNRSALPHRLETDRLPCLATRTPQAATHQRRNGRDVEGAEPVAAGPAGVEHRRDDRARRVAERLRIVRASPTISAGRSPFIASPISSPAICAGCGARPP